MSCCCSAATVPVVATAAVATTLSCLFVGCLHVKNVFTSTIILSTPTTNFVCTTSSIPSLSAQTLKVSEQNDSNVKRLKATNVHRLNNKQQRAWTCLTGGLDRSLAGGVLFKIPLHPDITSPTMASVCSTDPLASSSPNPANKIESCVTLCAASAACTE